MTDRQKNKLYAWEQKHVAPLDKNTVPFDNLQAIVNYVWDDMGLKYPPKIGKMPKNKHATADATRLEIRVHECGCTTWVLLHEMAHSLTANFEGDSHRHNARFVGVYLDLVCRYLPNANRLLLMASLKANKVDFNFNGICLT